MSNTQAPINPDTLAESDVVKVLMRQHQQVKDLLQEVSDCGPSDRADAFGRLRAMLAVHETAEEMIVRPITAKSGGQQVADARNHEEAEATEMLKTLERMDASSPEFAEKFQSLKSDVIKHAESEESQEFPILVAECGPSQRASMGRNVHAVEELAPTHPHPSTAGSPMAQWTVGPFAAMADRVRDALGSGRG